ncbi:hypothetical protein [Mucilaginibacter polytrichastri]|uniref:DUF2268 domain-containing protein n=1 Tax=Mucilaginibacter polytrichastri TaxID=1302689 RepID=A0A1Q5ZSP2_9SPHI|nr:hypothetical protein [Mucilaginibacter polytrichastri]OKS84789.1 hypothetical protein RG47T_0222 [Mucilaginibacter polytrichastri]SFT00266.1 hypothetical protein SAMN04487890_10819 [Mucilaginibacter polytrichastri]
MKKLSALLLLNLCILPLAYGQYSTRKVITTDIDNFWTAYDSIRTTNDSLKQLYYIQKLYVNRGTPGLKAFMEAKDYTPGSYVFAIRRYPKFWASVRNNTYKAKILTSEFDPAIKTLNSIYPELKPAVIYFTIGALNSAGTSGNGMVLIGAELATGDSTVDVSELPPALKSGLGPYFRSDPFQHIVPLNIHEYVHTQQHSEAYNLLAQCIYEGTCDFITELVTLKTLPLPYMSYGPEHQPELKAQFATEMFLNTYRNWLYNGTNNGKVGDLGYFMGYTICRSYYNHSKNKKQAIKDMIELNYADTTAVENFLVNSRYYEQSLAQLHQAYEVKRPIVTGVSVWPNKPVNPNTKEIKIDFSAVMGRSTAVDYGPGGKDTYPVTGISGFSPDKKSFTFKVDLQPDTDYDFIITGGGFRSAEGYPLVSYTVKFKTGPK